MPEKRYRFTNPEQAARRAGRLGWSNRTDGELAKLMAEPGKWTQMDNANLARIATALEGIRAELKQMRVARESRVEAVRIPAGG